MNLSNQTLIKRSASGLPNTYSNVYSDSSLTRTDGFCWDSVNDVWIGSSKYTSAMNLGKLLRSTDGGATWDDTTAHTPSNLHVVLPWHSASLGRIVSGVNIQGVAGTPMRIYSSDDNGENWTSEITSDERDLTPGLITLLSPCSTSPLHIPHPQWMLETDPELQNRYWNQNWLEIENWANALPNTSCLLHIPYPETFTYANLQANYAELKRWWETCPCWASIPNTFTYRNEYNPSPEEDEDNLATIQATADLISASI